MRARLSGVKSASYTTSELTEGLNPADGGYSEVEAHKPVIERETPHYFKCKDVKANVVRIVKMTTRGITVLEDGTDMVVGHYGFRQIPGERRRRRRRRLAASGERRACWMR